MPTVGSRALRTFFRKQDVFSGLEGRSLDSVMRVLKRESVPRGATVFHQGELGRTMYVLEEGEVEIRRANKDGVPVPIVRLGAGECFGEMALVEMEPRSATVVVTRKATVWSLTNLDLWKLFQEDNYAYVIVLQNICRLLSRRLRKADSRISDFLTPPKPVSTRRVSAVSRRA
jgi:CRP/FNR family cyclic AMP-dependent transcriptional regulator